MIFREATVEDVRQIQIVRNSVKENMLSDPQLVPDADVIDYLTRRGKGWVCEIEKQIVGFSIISLIDKNVWALFIHPEFEKQSIGRTLHSLMMDWYFSNTNETVWLSTAPGTRAEEFYKTAGWVETGSYGKGEVKFEMKSNDWTIE